MHQPSPLPRRAASAHRPLRSGALCAVLAASLAFGGCSSLPSADAQTAPWAGTVQSIRETQSSSGWQSMTGSLAGAALGAVLGSGIGAGTGKTIASIITSALGASAGQTLGAFLGAKPAYDVVVRGADGVDRTVQLKDKPAFMPGARVQVQGDGSVVAGN